MLSRFINVQVVYALALAILMAWAGHASARLLHADQAGWSSHADAHALARDVVTSCVLCADHPHAPLTADHVHETPHLPVPVRLSALPERLLPLAAPCDGVPCGSLRLIERPPRSTVVL